MNSPLVSICIPSYNQARYLRSAIESALSQTYDNIEVIVVDDGSTDDSLEVAQRYEASHPDSVKVFRHDDGSNKGVSATINVGIAQSRGNYWCVLGADDVFQRHKTKRQVAFLEKNAELSFVYSRADIINGSGDLVEGAMGRDITRTSDPIERMLCWNAIPASTVMVRRNGVRTAS